jgi:hypothetical protein
MDADRVPEKRAATRVCSVCKDDARPLVSGLMFGDVPRAPLWAMRNRRPVCGSCAAVLVESKLPVTLEVEA